jgi:hypothetical protein
VNPTDALLIIGTKAAVTLLPLVPAYVLFKTLRSHARVTGPMAGLKVQLGGAFGAYFIVFLVLFQGLGAEVSRFQYHNWTVAGRVEFDTDGEKPNPHHITTYMKPPLLPIEPDGKFEFTVPIQEFADGHIEWPTILLEMAGYEQGVIRLAPNLPGWGSELLKLDRDRDHRVLNVTQPVKLKPQSYSATSLSVTPLLTARNQ